MMMNWISAEYDFGRRIKGIFIPGRNLKSWGIHAHYFFSTPQAAVENLMREASFKDYLPSDAKCVRVHIPQHQDGLVLYFLSAQFKEPDEGSLIEITHLEDLVRSERETATKT